MKKLFLISFFLFLLVQTVLSDVGFEYLNDSVHVWNEGEPKSDWYFSDNEDNDGALMQLSNIPFPDVWEVVKHGVSYGNTTTQILNNYREISDAYNMNRIDVNTSENVSLIAWKDFIYAEKNIRFAKYNFIGEYDDHMQQTYYVKAFENININTYFVLHRTNITVGGDYENDYLKLTYKNYTNTTYINLTYHDENNLTTIFSGSNLINGFFLVDGVTGENIAFSHDYILDTWWVVIKNKEVYVIFENPPMDLNDEITLDTYWVDATQCSSQFGSIFYKEYIQCGGDGSCDVEIGESFFMQCKYVMSYGDYQGDAHTYEYYQGTWQKIPGSSSTIDCNGANCVYSNPSPSTWYSKTIVGEGHGNWDIRCKWTCGKYVFYSTSLNANITDSSTPVVTIQIPEDNSYWDLYLNGSNVSIDYTVTDDTGVDIIQFSNDSGLSWNTITDNITWNYPLGLANATIRANDTLGNGWGSDSANFTVIDTTPTIEEYSTAVILSLGLAALFFIFLGINLLKNNDLTGHLFFGIGFYFIIIELALITLINTDNSELFGIASRITAVTTFLTIPLLFVMAIVLLIKVISYYKCLKN